MTEVPAELLRDFTAWAVIGSLARVADTGLVVESDQGIRLTDAGDVFVTAWLGYMEER